MRMLLAQVEGRADAPASGGVAPFKAASFGVLELAAGGRVVNANAAFRGMLGYEPTDIEGRALASLLYREPGAPARADPWSFLLATVEMPAEIKLRHKSGAPIWVLLSLSKAEGGESHLAVVIPIDGQKQREAAAARELEHLSFALDAANQGIWNYDGLRDVWTFSAAWKRMRGISLKVNYTAQGLDWLETIHPDDRAMVKDYTERQYSGELDEVAFQYREKHRDGHWMWILARGRALGGRTADGRPLRIVGTDTDITDLKLKEQDFETVSRRLELALATSRVGVWETDLRTGAAFWDARTNQLFGREDVPVTVPPGTWENLLHPEDRAKTIAICQQGLATERGYGCDYRVILYSGEMRHIRCRATLVKDADGEEKLVGVNWDVSEDLERAAALLRAKQLAEDHSAELEIARKSLEYISLHDALTGLPNRRYLDSALARMAMPDGNPHDLTLLHIDLDRFKQINDTKGHAAGDALLVHTAELLRSHVRTGDIVARIGGDEFVVVLSPAPEKSDLDRVVKGIIASAGRPFIWEGQECRSGVSIGIAEARNASCAHQLLVNADISLYRAKRAGRNCAAYFTAALQAETIANKQCADDIQLGIERGEFLPYYQPQFDAQTLKLTGVEALARWRHPLRGVLTPDKFLAVANDINAVSLIDRIILEQAARDLAVWDMDGLHVDRVSVNVSARRLGSELSLESLQVLPVAPQRISFELLESIFLDEHNDEIVDNIEKLKALGFSIEIDDFGSGHASIVGLLRIRPHQFKIDRKLVAPIVNGQQERRLVKSIIDIGKSQDIAICAEGVETALHADILRDLGCDQLQGFYFAKPMARDEFAAFAQSKPWIGEVVIPDGSPLREFLRENGLAKPVDSSEPVHVMLRRLAAG